VIVEEDQWVRSSDTEAGGDETHERGLVELPVGPDHKAPRVAIVKHAAARPFLIFRPDRRGRKALANLGRAKADQKRWRVRAASPCRTRHASYLSAMASARRAAGASVGSRCGAGRAGKVDSMQLAPPVPARVPAEFIGKACAVPG
jgi:hypothetical protein